ncbi:hypothetical protein [Tractidigestivibacter scatoligenes]|jgi:hypothetical protein|uniref:hypothetical protein n=1 Tax=Tractidigestivibacter scatoligenes TaxID=1299998 RepID=UPI002F35BCAF
MLEGNGSATVTGLERERLAGAVAAVLWDSDPTQAADLTLVLGSATCALDLVALDVSAALRDPGRAAALAADLDWVARETPDARVAQRAMGLAATVTEAFAPPSLEDAGQER